MVAKLDLVEAATADGCRPRSGRPSPLALYERGGKRLLDLLLVLLALPVWLPLVVICAVAVAVDGGQPFYTQARVGRHGRRFRIVKLRTMVPDAEARLAELLATDPAAAAEWNRTQKLRRDPRITRIGAVLRRTSLDELPQFLNVLMGSMSLVGPRPMMPGQESIYPGSRYYAMRPGVSGFWQVSNRNECRFRDRARYDDAYWAALSLRTDLTILVRTVRTVLRATGF
jgi:lipopolysaccharide/colanic/teichoic acid biosynthesis glycosyltransferase